MAAAQKKSSGGKGTAASGKETAAKKTASTSSAGKRAKKPAAKKSTAGKAKGNRKAAGKKTSSGKQLNKKLQAAGKKDYSLLKDITVILLFVFCVILLISCFVTSGRLMELLHTYNFRYFGLMAYILPFLLFILPCFVISNWGNKGLFTKLSAIVIGFLAVTSVLSIFHETTNVFLYGGGEVGAFLFHTVEKALGTIGSYVLMAALILVSLVLFFGHSMVSGLHTNSQKAYEAVSSKRRIQMGKRKIRMQEKQLHRQQAENELLEQQRIRLEELSQQRQLEQERASVIREFVDIRLEETKKQEEKNRLIQKQETKAKREFRTNTELEEQDRSMKEITLPHAQAIPIDEIADRQTQTRVEKTEKTEEQSPSMFIEGEEITQVSPQHDLDYPLRLDTGSDTDFSDQDKETFWKNPEPQMPENDLPPKDAYPEAENDQPEPEQAENEAVWDDAAREEEGEDLSGADVPGDESVDYRTVGQSEGGDTPLTKTVQTATGKVITVELDGLPGERLRPGSPVKKPSQSNPYEEKIVPTVYEEPKEYIFPPLDLLTSGAGSAKGKEELARSMKETASKLQKTLQDFGVGVTITNISRGPSVTRYELQPEQGVKVSKIVSLTDDIKLNLAAEDIRIEAPIPGKAAIGIEVPNKEKQMVAFRDLLESDEFTKAKSKTVFAAGKDIAGKTVVADIEKMPHLLIAGQTGSGKSVCINTIIMSILYKARPSEVKLIMIDPKVVELSVYNGIPHLLIPVVTDPKKAAAALNWAVNEMEERYQKFARFKARNIIGYNALIDQIEDVPGKDRPEKIPQIIVIVDELADLIMTAAGDVEDAIQKLAQKARAAGIHLIIATQRPSVNVITGVIKANIPSRIAFSVASGVDSRTILDEVGAEKLLGKGDMLFHPYYISKPVRVQGAFVSDEEVTEVVNFLTQQKNVKGGQINTNIDLQANMPGTKLPGDEQDELFATAGRFIIEQEKASIGNLQRHLRIGFNRAARIMDQLFAAGVVSREEGTKPRKVLMKQEEFEEYLSGR